MNTIDLEYLDTRPASQPVGVTCTIPWPRGFLQPRQLLGLFAEGGQPIPSQSRPLGYWPDGSVKWSAVAAVLRKDHGSHLRCRPIERSPETDRPLAVTETEDSLIVTDGSLEIVVGMTGRRLIRRITRDGVELCGGVRLVSLRERRSGTEDESTVRRTLLAGVIDRVCVEQRGPILSVFKIEGRHIHANTGESWLPFVLRCYVYSGAQSIRLVHTFIYDGRAEQDFIAGVGVEVAVQMRDAPHNRRVWFSLDDEGVWSEPIRGVPPAIPRDSPEYPKPNPDRIRHIRGDVLLSPGGTEAMPVWNVFEQVQVGANQFVVRKGTGREHALIDTWSGQRAGGTVGVTDSQGGLLLGMKDFWQGHPSALTVENAGSPGPAAAITAWFWPPQAEAADMRHYTDRMFGPVYECHDCLNWEAGPADLTKSNAYGVARTSELSLRLLGPGADRNDVTEWAALSARPVVVTCRPEHYHECRVFGVWSLPDDNTPHRRSLEKRLTDLLDYYLRQVDHFHWYGFWNYGDIMHGYDEDRHLWRYDEGGFAWDNTECSTDLWLWYSFLRTGRSDLYRFAEAMSRHNGEVDVYHLGPYSGRGSRHNVRHWGCACIEPRISMAGGRRFFYFLSADERTGDLLEEACDAWPREKTPMLAAPWWANFCWNWITAWERSGDEKYRRKLIRGVRGILAKKPALCCGLNFNFDPDTGEMSFIEDQEPYPYYMAVPFGAPEIWMEMLDLLGSEAGAWAEALADFGALWAVGPDRTDTIIGDAHLRPSIMVFAARLLAYAARQRREPAWAEKAWQVLDGHHLDWATITDPHTGESRRELRENESHNFHSNSVAQWSLSVIESLALEEDE